MRATAWILTVSLVLTVGATRPSERAGAAPVPATLPVGKRAFGPPAAYPAPAEASHVLAAIDRALERVWELPDPRESVVCLVDAISKLDGPRACARARSVSAKLIARDLPPARSSPWEHLAVTVAPWDLDLRDEFLWLARSDAARALKTDDLWIAPPLPPGQFPRSNPQNLLNYERDGLEYRSRLWAAIVEYERDRERGTERARALFAETAALPLVSLGCISRAHSGNLGQALAQLDPRLYFALERPEHEATNATACGRFAYDRWLNGYRDGITGTYAVRALGTESVFDLSPHAACYDTAAALERALKLPAVPHDIHAPRVRALAVLLSGKAWTDPEGALALAEAEQPGPAASASSPMSKLCGDTCTPNASTARLAYERRPRNRSAPRSVRPTRRCSRRGGATNAPAIFRNRRTARMRTRTRCACWQTPRTPRG